MDEPFSLLLLVVVIPVTYLTARAAPRSPVIAGLVGVGLLGLIALNAPWGGLSFAEIKRFNFLIVATTAAVLWGSYLGIPWLACTRNRCLVLLPTVALALLGHTNFLQFHGNGQFTHLHDVAHYYLGSKYFSELGYGTLYVAMVRAEAESTGHSFTDQARDLEGNYLRPIGELLDQSDPVKQRFSPERWRDFQKDVLAFRQSMGAGFAEILYDHGFNPTPAWARIGGFISNQVPAGSMTGINLLAALDPVLLLLTFTIVGRVFGLEATLLAIVYFATAFGCEFPWKGGAFLRELSFCGVLLTAAALERTRFGLAGAMLGLITALRVFPALLAFGLAAQAAGQWWRERKLPKAHLRFAIGSIVAGSLLLAVSILPADGLGQWDAFRANTAAHMESASANLIGLTGILSYALGATDGDINTMTEQRNIAQRVQRIALLPAVGLLIFLLAQRASPPATLVLSVGLLLSGLNVSGYYYAILAIVPLIFRDRPYVVALLFTVEAILGAARLYEQHDVMLYIAKSFLLVLLWITIFLLPERKTLENTIQIDSSNDGL